MEQAIEDAVRARAHALWEAEGRPEGREHDHWQEAERQILAERDLEPPAGPEDAAGPGDRIPADPLRNPEPASAGPERGVLDTGRPGSGGDNRRG